MNVSKFGKVYTNRHVKMFAHICLLKEAYFNLFKGFDKENTATYLIWVSLDGK